ncbi:MAG TPA: hypothetical protein VGN41_15770, partial [Streptosporangiaceae bacterium]
PDSQIHVTDVPTGPDGGGRFFSHRAERPCGRFAAVARLRPPGPPGPGGPVGPAGVKETR